MNSPNIKTLFNCWKVGIFTTILDLVIFSILQQTDIDLSKQLYISIGITTLCKNIWHLKMKIKVINW